MKELIDIQCFIINKLDASMDDADYIMKNSGINYVKFPSHLKYNQEFLDELSNFTGIPLKTDQTSEYILVYW